MAIAFTALTGTGTATDSTSLTTPSITPTANNLVIAAVENDFGTDPPAIPTVSGCSLTWIQVATATFFSTTGGRVTVFVAMGASPTAGAVTFDCGAFTQTGWNYSICQASGIETSGALQAVAQATAVTTGGTTTFTATLSTPPHNGLSATYAALAHNTNEVGAAQASPYVLLHQPSHGTPARSLMTEYSLTAQQSASGIWISSGFGFGIVMEVRPPMDTTFAGVPI